MTILCDHDLHILLNNYPNFLTANSPYDPHEFVNPASIDIHVGQDLWRESLSGFAMRSMPLEGHKFAPGEFALVATHESFQVPDNYALELRLRSTSARQGWDHSLAFWVDPGWNGVLTMEVKNITRFQYLTLTGYQRFAQIIVHKLSGRADKPYRGKYNNANLSSLAKEDLA